MWSDADLPFLTFRGVWQALRDRKRLDSVKWVTSQRLSRIAAALLVMIASMIGAIAMALLLHEEPITGVVGSSPTAMPLPPVTTVGTPPGTSSIPGVATLGHPAPTPPTTAQPVPVPMWRAGTATALSRLRTAPSDCDGKAS